LDVHLKKCTLKGIGTQKIVTQKELWPKKVALEKSCTRKADCDGAGFAESSSVKTRIIVVTHKDYPMPEDTELYVPVQVGRASRIRPEWRKDDEGENISAKNQTFCELTALYWAWKNLDAETLGLCHYRRYFGSPEIGIQKISAAEIGRLLETADVILPKKRHYWIETRESQYAHAHHEEDLKCAEGILRERYPEYMEAWKWMLQTRSGHICNMFIMRREHVNEYCVWLFDILFEVEKRLDISGYAEKDKRVFGYLGERLLDVWIRKNGIKYAEVPMIVTEDQHWVKKGITFLRRKFGIRG